MAAGFNSPQILFLNTWDEPERNYLFPIFQKLRQCGYTRFVEPCAGAFVMPSIAVEGGWPKSTMFMSDVSLFSSLMGFTFMGKDLTDLDVRVDGEPLTFPAKTPVSRQAATVLYRQLVLRMAQRPELPYWDELRHDLDVRADEHIAAIEKRILKLDERMHGVHYAPRDIWEHVESVADDPQTVVSVNPPTYCLRHDQRVLTNDLRWVAVGDVRVGDTLMGFDEFTRKSTRRNFKPAVVVHSSSHIKPCVRVSLDDGTHVICTDYHRWLVDSGSTGTGRFWVRAQDLLTHGKRGPKREARYALRAFTPWRDDQSFEAGWMSGIYDGEGNLNARAGKKASFQLTASQNTGEVLDHIITTLRSYGFSPSVAKNAAEGTCHRVTISESSEVARALGIFRPRRLLPQMPVERACRIIGRSEIVGVEPAGEHPVQTITTTAGTYIGEGWLMGNCGGFEKFYDTGGRLTWKEPTYEVFDAQVDVFKLLDLMKDRKALILCQQQQEPGKHADWPVYARHLSLGQYVYIVTNRPDEALEVAGGMKVVPIRAKEIQRLNLPTLPFDYDITETSTVQVMAVGDKEATYYRDLWMHKLDYRSAGYYVAVVLDGHLAGMIGYDAGPIYRPYSDAQDTKGALLLTFAVGAPSARRLTRLVTMVALAKETLTSVLRPDLAVLVEKLVTVELTKHPEAKGLRGVMQLLRRKKDPKYGWRLVYTAQATPTRLKDLPGLWRKKEDAWLRERAKQVPAPTN